MSTQPWNFLQTEADIIERLKETTMKAQNGIPAWCRRVYSRQELASIKEEKQVTPSLYVVYMGETVLDATARQTLEAHKYVVALIVKNAAAQRSAMPLNTEAGVLLPRVKAALKGFVPVGAIGPLQQVTPPPPDFINGFAYYPAQFIAKVAFSMDYGVAQARPTPTNSKLTPTVAKR